MSKHMWRGTTWNDGLTRGHLARKDGEMSTQRGFGRFAVVAGRAVLVVAALLTSLQSAQASPSVRKSTDQRGDFLMFGNVLAVDCANPPTIIGGTGVIGSCGSQTGDTGRDVYWRADATTTGVADANTTITAANARSTAALTTGTQVGSQLPSGAEITYARLYWGASADNGSPANTATLERPGVFSTTVTADSQVVRNVGGTPAFWYQATADVTTILQTYGVGAYRLGGVAISNMVNVNSETTYGGWAIVVFYQDTSATVVRNLTVFDGLDVVPSGTTVDVTINGFLVPNAGFDAKLGAVAYEGDGSLASDVLRFHRVFGNLGNNAARLSDNTGVNTNFFNGTRSVPGAFVSISGDIPQTNGQLEALSGMDIDVVNVTSRVQAGDTQAFLRAQSTGETFSMGVWVTSIATLKPDFTTTTKTVTNLNTHPGGVILAGDTLEYTIVVTNTGTDTSQDTYLEDTVPTGLTYVAGSISISSGPNSGSKTDAAGDDQAEYDGAQRKVTVRLGTGANAATGGQLTSTPQESTTVVFRVTVNAGTTGVVSNQAFITSEGVTGATQGIGPVTVPSGDGQPARPTDAIIHACADNTNCSEPTPVCDTSVSPHVCVDCVADSDCSGDTPICELSTNTCRGCTSDAECPVSLPVCNTVAGRCGECLDNTDCSGGTPACNPSDNLCVRCVLDSDCPTSATCTVATNTCALAAPVVNTPSNGSTTNDPTPTITGTGPANVTIEVIMDGASAGTTTTDASGNWSFTPAANLTLASHTVRARARSGSGVLEVISADSNTNTFSIIGCGDTIIQAGEGCDDGNTTNGDGCNSACLAETGSPCNATAPGLIGDASCLTGICDLTGGSPGVCEVAGCGDGHLQAGEGCDDGNTTNGDGCNSTCLKETGTACNATAPGLIGDPSCATGICDSTNGPTGTCEAAGCGDNHLQSGEGCDDGNTTNGDGCNSACLKETGTACNATAPGLIGDPSCATGICDSTNGPTGTCEVAGCGDNHLQSGEGCDDGNTTNGDGCNSACRKETGTACNATAPGLIGDPSCATGICDSTNGPTGTCEVAGCGDNHLQSGEGCDDGNTTNGDGCNSACLKETGTACNATAPGLIGDPSCATGICDSTNGPTGTCEVAGCGDNHLQSGEGCDDGNTTNGDGCNSACLKETGRPCNATAPGLIGDASCLTGICDLTGGSPGVCEVAGCGDGHLQAGEGCDDGNTTNGDGCNSACLKETGTACNATAPGLIGDPSCATGICDSTNGPTGTCEVAGCGDNHLQS
ncbi:MAG: DUF4215 domain-containing protein, partial [Myxococcota bacterium]